MACVVVWRRNVELLFITVEFAPLFRHLVSARGRTVGFTGLLQWTANNKQTY